MNESQKRSLKLRIGSLGLKLDAAELEASATNALLVGFENGGDLSEIYSHKHNNGEVLQGIRHARVALGRMRNVNDA